MMAAFWGKAADERLSARNQIYLAMVVYELLTYKDGEVSIPNRELMEKFDELLLTKDSLGYVYRLARESDRILQLAFDGIVQSIAEEHIKIDGIHKGDGLPADHYGQRNVPTVTHQFFSVRSVFSAHSAT